MCGLIGWVGNDPTKFNFSKLHTLGVLNETRGRHSCGISFDNEIWTGVYQEKLWRDFAPAIKDVLEEYPLINPIVVGHTRWASVGGNHGKDNAHPFGYGDNKDGGYETVGVHNGTILEYEKLAKKFGIQTTVGRKKNKRNKIDSEILLEIIHKYGTDVLNEYNGGAALLWYHSEEPNVLYAYHGKSKTYKSSYTDTEERPLFWLLEEEGSLYISSLEDSLVAINDTGGEIDKFEYNTLYKIKNGDIKNAELIEIDRSNCFQKGAIVHNSGNNWRNNWNGHYWEADNHLASNKDNKNPEKKKEEEKEVEIIDLSKEKLKGKFSEFKHEVYYNRTRYWKNEKIITGVFAPMKHDPMCYLGDTAKTAKENYLQFSDINKYSEEPLLFFFYRGIALETELDYNIATDKNKNILNIQRLSHMSKYPIIELWSKDSKVFYNGQPATDFVLPFLSKKLYTFADGKCISSEIIPEESSFEKYRNAINESDLVANELINSKNSVIEIVKEGDDTIVVSAKEDLEIAVDEAMDEIEEQVTSEQIKEEALGLFQIIKDQIINTFESLWQK